jgi:hypothetical protein
MSELSTTWGLVDQAGTIFVKLEGEWVTIGSFPDGTPEEAHALYASKHADLEAQVLLAEQRLKAGANAKDIQRSVQKLHKELEKPATIGDIVSLRARVTRLAEALQPLIDAQKVEKEKAVEDAIGHRESLVAKIEELAKKDPGQIRWKETTETVNELFAAWQEHQQNGPRLPKATGDDLWKRFRNARNTLDRHRRAHFQERDKANKEAKAIKSQLIEKAEALAPKGAEGIPAYRTLLEEWKKAPRATRSVDDALWTRFKTAGDALYQAKSQQDQAADEANQENGAAKQALIDKYKSLLDSTDPDQASGSLRSFFDEFKKIGPVPRADIKKIDQQVRAFETHVKALQEKKWQDNDPEKKARSSSFLEQLAEQIQSLDAKISEAEKSGDKALAAELTEERDAKIAWQKALEG